MAALISRVIVCVVTVLCFIAPGTAGAQQTPAEDLPIVRVRVNAAYDDSPETARSLTKLSVLLPPREVTLKSKGTISALIAEVYGFGISNYKAAYDALEKSILDLNKLARPEDAQAGTIRIPIVPPRALEQPNPSKTLNNVPKLMDYTAMAAKVASQAVSGESELVLRGGPEFHQTGRKAAQETFVETAVTESQLAALEADSDLRGRTLVVSRRMQVELAAAKDQGPVTPLPPLVTDDDVKLLSAKLAGAQHTGFMFVLDSGWPSERAYKESKRNLLAIIDTIRDRYKLGKRTATLPDAKFTGPNETHCQLIDEALAPLARADTAGKVKVIYLPLTREQEAGELLEELLTVYYMATSLHEELGETKVPDPGAAAKLAAKVVAKLPEKWTGKTVTTNEAVIAAALYLGDLYGKLTNTGMVFNESWTVPSGRLYVLYPSPFAGVVVAAVGNEGPNQDINRDLRDFAQRSLTMKDTIAVMATENGKLTCDSSTIGDDALDVAMAVAFNGRVTDKACGTSFAAPRVAWFIAAAEAVRTDPWPPQVGMWEVSLAQRLFGARPAGTGLAKLWFDYISFLSIKESK